MFTDAQEPPKIFKIVVSRERQMIFNALSKKLNRGRQYSSKSDRQEADLLRPKLTVAGRDTRIGSSEFTAVQVDCEISLEKALLSHQCPYDLWRYLKRPWHREST